MIRHWLHADTEHHPKGKSRTIACVHLLIVAPGACRGITPPAPALPGRIARDLEVPTVSLESPAWPRLAPTSIPEPCRSDRIPHCAIATRAGPGFAPGKEVTPLAFWTAVQVLGLDQSWFAEPHQHVHDLAAGGADPCLCLRREAAVGAAADLGGIAAARTVE